MIIHPTKKHLIELSNERDFTPSATPTHNYCILSTQRCGSTLLSRTLYETGKAGDPLEYFNPSLLSIIRNREKNSHIDYKSFIETMKKRRTSPNGYFGIKSHYSQMLKAFNCSEPTNEILKFLKSQDSLIWIRRKDKISQAISLSIAEKTRIWSSEENEQPPESVSIENETIKRNIIKLSEEDEAWGHLIKKNNFNALEIWYEDLTTNFSLKIRQVIEHLKLSEEVAEIPPPPIKQQRTNLNSKLLENFLLTSNTTLDYWQPKDSTDNDCAHNNI